MQATVERRDLRGQQNIVVKGPVRSEASLTSLFNLIQDLSSPITVRLKNGGPSVTFQANLSPDQIRETFNSWLVAPYSHLKNFSAYSIEKAIVKMAALDEQQKIVLKLTNQERGGWNKIAVIEGLTLREFLTERSALFGTPSAKPVVIEQATPGDWNISQLLVDIPEGQPQGDDYSAIEGLFTDPPSSGSSIEPSLIVVQDFLPVYSKESGWAFSCIKLSKSNPFDKQTITAIFSRGRTTIDEKILNKTLPELRDNCQIFFGVSEIKVNQINLPPRPAPKPAPLPTPKKVTHLSKRNFFIAIPVVLLSTALLLLYLNRETIQVWPTKNNAL